MRGLPCLFLECPGLRRPLTIAAAQDWLTQAEIDTLPLGAQTIIFEQAVRFLTDHLEGDVYYPVSQPGHNLTRARVQYALLESLIAQASAS